MYPINQSIDGLFKKKSSLAYRHYTVDSRPVEKFELLQERHTRQNQGVQEFIKEVFLCYCNSIDEERKNLPHIS